MIGRVANFYDPLWLNHEIIEEALNKTREIGRKLEQTSEPTDICVLPNNILAVASMFGYNISLYDDELNLIRIVEKIGNDQIRPFALATDNKTRIYMTNSINYDSILITDLEFNEIADPSYLKLELYGICFAHDHVYSCDFGNNCIIKLTPELDLIEKYNVNYSPWLIKVINNTVIIKSGNTKELYFYDIDKFQLMHKYEECYGRISVINGLFYDIIFEQNKMNIFKENGEFIKCFNLNCLSDYETDTSSGCMVYFCSYLVVSFQAALCAIKVK